MGMEEKELAKAFFGFTQVPFCVVVSPEGVVVFAGEPKSMNLKTLFVSSVSAENEGIASNVQATAQPAFVLDDDF